MAQVQRHVHLPGLFRPWGGKPRGPFQGSVSQTQEKAAQATPKSPAISRKKAWGWACRRNLRTGPDSRWQVSPYWAAGLTGVRAWIVSTDLLVVVHRGCDRLTLAGVRLATGITGHSRCGSCPMQIHRLLTNLPHVYREPPRAIASPSPGGSQ